MSELFSWIDPSVKIGKNSDRQADVDFVMYDQKIIVLGEIKSSPLVVYPLEISLDRPMTEVRNGDSVLKRDHTPATSDITTTDISLYIPHQDLRIHLGNYNNTNWSYHKLTEYINDTDNLAVLISAWKELFDVYVETLKPQEKRQTQIDTRRWLTCGCGGKVDDSKNAPGIDRTDDIKKGTYQVLKFGTYYKEKCPRRNIRAVLASNFFPHRKFDRYWSEMRDSSGPGIRILSRYEVSGQRRWLPFRNTTYFTCTTLCCVSPNRYIMINISRNSQAWKSS